MTQKEYLIAGLIAFVGFAAPVIPSVLTQLLDNILIRILIVAAALYAITKGPMIGIATVIAISLLYMERNRQKVNGARQKFEKIQEATDPAQMTVEDEGIPQNTVPVREFEEPDAVNSTYLPGPRTGSDEFNRVFLSEDLNDKRILPTVPIGNKSAPLFANYLH
jgi:hypothetical protein